MRSATNRRSWETSRKNVFCEWPSDGLNSRANSSDENSIRSLLGRKTDGPGAGEGTVVMMDTLFRRAFSTGSLVEGAVMVIRGCFVACTAGEQSAGLLEGGCSLEEQPKKNEILCNVAKFFKQLY